MMSSSTAKTVNNNGGDTSNNSHSGRTELAKPSSNPWIVAVFLFETAFVATLKGSRARSKSKNRHPTSIEEAHGGDTM